MAIPFGEFEKRLYLCSVKKVVSSREIDFSARGNRFLARKNIISRAEIEFSARDIIFVIKIKIFIH